MDPDHGYDEPRELIAAEVRAEMARQKKRGRELGEVLGLSLQSVWPRIAGETSFRAEEIFAIARWLKVPVEHFAQVAEAAELARIAS